MKALSDDLRLRIYEACEGGDPAAEVAERFAISESTVARLKRRFRETGTLAPKLGGRGPTPKLAARREELGAAVAEHPDHTPAEHQQRLGLEASRWTVMRCIRALGLTRKKTVFPSEWERPDVQALRTAWPTLVEDIAPEKLVFIDETHTNRAMNRTRGYATSGQRVIGLVPKYQWRAVTFLGASTTKGLLAPWAQEGVVNGEFFCIRMEQILVPHPTPCMVVMDNVPTHKVTGVRAAIESAGC